MERVPQVVQGDKVPVTGKDRPPILRRQVQLGRIARPRLPNRERFNRHRERGVSLRQSGGNGAAEVFVQVERHGQGVRSLLDVLADVLGMKLPEAIGGSEGPLW